MLFKNRKEAGVKLAKKLSLYKDQAKGIVLALPRGGVPVAYEVAQRLHLPLDVFIVRKLGVPGHQELAMGAIASNGVRVLNQELVQSFGITPQEIERVTQIEKEELLRREKLYRGQRAFPDLQQHKVILIDDGLATGSTMLAALHAIREKNPQALMVAVPLASPDVCNDFKKEVDDIVCLHTPEPFYAVGEWYEDFSQTTDEEVRELLEKSKRHSQNGN